MRHTVSTQSTRHAPGGPISPVGHLRDCELSEFCMLAAQYDGLAATITTLKVPLDFPD